MDAGVSASRLHCRTVISAFNLRLYWFVFRVCLGPDSATEFDFEPVE